MNSEFMELLEEIEKEKGITHDAMISAIENALISAYKRSFSPRQDVVVKIDPVTGQMTVYLRRTVVEDEAFANDEAELTLEEAHKINKELKIGDHIDEETNPPTFGRIAAQTARQVVTQRIREAERDQLFAEFSDQIGQIVTGIVRRNDQGRIIVEIGKAEAMLLPQEQIKGETYNLGDRIKVYVVEVSNSGRGPKIMISRSHPGLVRRLMEMEVPELQSGVIEIMGIAREAGWRTKVAVRSVDGDVDPVGACVGARGSRIQAVVAELGNEKVDIIMYSMDLATYVIESLSPAKVTHAHVDHENEVCHVVVPDTQLSLAIGKEGQNARLTARLTGVKVDIKSESVAAEG